SAAVSHHVDPIFILNKVLNTEMTLSVGELLGVSKEVSTRLTDLLKVTHSIGPVPSHVNTVNTAIISNDLDSDLDDLCEDIYVPPAPPVLLLRTQSPLIQVLVTCNGKSIMAVIDTGATQNVCST
ncbi:hypothetical protein BYT27DRAFT_7077259, partial [Phlegmacium glaucopus]